jgi:hypothetical protein
MSAMPEHERAPTGSPPVRRRRRIVVGTALAVLAGLYLALVLIYAAGESAQVMQSPVERPPGGVGVVLTARTITALGGSMHVDVTIDPDDSLLGDDGTVREPITVSLDPTQEDTDLVYDAGKRPQSHSATLLFDGDIQDWPFDSYTTPISAFVTVGQGPAVRVVDSVIEVEGGVQGWDLAAATDPDVPDLLVDASFDRSPAIVLFGLALVVVLILLPVTCWIVGLKLYRERRLFEAGFLGWIAALLFATIPIRTFFPGSPPPGSWVDVLVVLWVIVALTVGLLIGVASFIKHPRPTP